MSPPLWRAFTLFTLAGPVIGGLGLYFAWPLLFWGGVVIAAVNLFLNLASGAMQMPVLPVLFVLVGAVAFSPWYKGAGTGLLVWTALEAAGEILPPRWNWLRKD